MIFLKEQIVETNVNNPFYAFEEIRNSIMANCESLNVTDKYGNELSWKDKGNKSVCKIKSINGQSATMVDYNSAKVLFFSDKEKKNKKKKN